MNWRTPLLTALFLALAALPGAGWAADPKPPEEPVLRVEARGPGSFVTTLAFSPDGETLYSAGFDRVVRVWTRGKDGQFKPQAKAFRVPIGPGIAGGEINALALSEDGNWLAVGGNGWSPTRAGFRQPGIYLPQPPADKDTLLDQGTLYVFDTTTGTVQELRGHHGPVRALAFAPGGGKTPPPLVSAAVAAGRKDAELFLWDFANPKAPAQRAALPPTEPRPALVPWGDGVKDVQVAVGWGDGPGPLRFWDCPAGKGPEAVANELNNNALALLPGPNGPALLVGNYFGDRPPKPGRGELSLWSLPGRGKKPAPLKVLADFPHLGDGTPRVPWAVCPVSANADGVLDHAAVVLRQPIGDDKSFYRLHLVDLATGKSKANLPLWSGDDGVPTLAASPRSKDLAVAGNRDHSVYVMPVADLLKGADELPSKPLHSEGTSYGAVAFVKRPNAKKQDELGLALGEQAEAWNAPPHVPRKGDAFFAFTGPELSGGPGAWQAASPDTANVKAKLEGDPKAGPLTLVVSHNKEAFKVPLRPKTEVTAFAFLPAAKPLDVPLVALALEDGDHNPSLELYHGGTGDLLRHFTGHLARVRGLAFSADGRLLASAGEDQTVCVWSLTDLGNLIGKRGRLKGVVLETLGEGKDSKVRVARLLPGEVDKANAGLEEGAVLEGIVKGDAVTPLASARAFYVELFYRGPGKTKLRLAGGKDLEVVLGQGADERQPLLTLFTTRDGKIEERKWVGWTPAGLYESSDPAVEKFVGWHQNTDDPKNPATFVEAKDYRKENHRPGLLRLLVLHGELDKALNELNAKPVPRPTMTLWPSGPGIDSTRARLEDSLLLQPVLPEQRLVTLNLSLAGINPDTQVAGVGWQVGDKQGEMQRGAGTTWKADLNGVSWKRGVQVVRAVVTTAETPPRQFTKELTVHYQPPAPRLKAAGGQRVVLVDQDEYKLELEVAPGDAGETAVVEVRRGGKLVERQEVKEARQLAVPLKDLAEGENAVRVVVNHKDATGASEEAETVSRSLLVVYNPKEAPRPEITLLEVIPVDAEGQEGQAVPIEGGQAVVDQDRVSVKGTVKARGGKLTEATWARKGDKGDRLKEFKPEEQLSFTQYLGQFAAGETKAFVFRAQNAKGKEAEAAVSIEYRPRLPAVVKLETVPSSVNWGDPNVAAVKLVAGLGKLPNDAVFAAAVLVGGKEVPGSEVKADRVAGTVTATVPLKALAFGGNTLQLRLSNAFKADPVIAETLVEYGAAPRDVKFDDPGVPGAATVDLVAHVRSPLPPRAEGSKVLVRGAPAPAVKVKVEAEPAADTYRVTLGGVPLDNGDNEVLLWVANEKAVTPDPARVSFRVDRKAPEVFIDSPAVKAATVPDPNYEVSFTVHSGTPLSKVEVRTTNQGEDPKTFPVNLEGLKPDGEKKYVVSGKQAVAVDRKGTVVEVVAVNASAETAERRVLTYLPMPPALRGLRLVVPGRSDVVLQPASGKPDASGALLCPAAPVARLKLQGELVWHSLADPALQGRRLGARVWVNGAPQRQVLLKAAQGSTRSFEADVLLTRQEGNYVEVELLNVPLDTNQKAEARALKLDCAKPEVNPQQLHLILLGLGEVNEKQLKAKAFEALHLKADADPETFHSDTFATGHLYPCLTKRISLTRLTPILESIQDELKRRLDKEGVADVVVIYYQGEEGEEQGQRVLKTGEPTGIGQDFLEEEFAGIAGVPLLLLDVKGKEGATQSDYLNVLRSAWMTQREEPAQLLETLKDLLPRTRKLGEVNDNLKQELASKFKPEKLQYQGQVSRGSVDLILNKKKEQDP
jgi:WD40 repeat protein